MNIQEELFKLQDLSYKNFISKLIPNINKDVIIGVKIPLIRTLAKKINFEDTIKFINDLPHKYHEENILHTCLMNIYIKDLDTYLEYLDKFLPYIDNWEVCDTLNPKIFKKDYNKVHKYLLNILKDKRTYYKRFAIVSLLQFYLGNNLYKKDLITLSKIKSNDYYVNMAISWYYSVALIKNYEEVVPLFENKILDKWIHNKSIQKAIESYRISDERKSYLRSLKIK